MKGDVPAWRRVPAPNRWLSAYWHPPQVGRYRIRKFSAETNEWFEGVGFYFGGMDRVWRLLQEVDGTWINKGPLSIEGLEYHEDQL